MDRDLCVVPNVGSGVKSVLCLSVFFVFKQHGSQSLTAFSEIILIHVFVGLWNCAVRVDLYC